MKPRVLAINGFAISGAEIDDLLAFFDSLTDSALVTDPALSSPWPTVGGRTP